MSNESESPPLSPRTTTLHEIMTTQFQTLRREMEQMRVEIKVALTRGDHSINFIHIIKSWREDVLITPDWELKHASSSKTKRPRTSGSKQGGSSSKSNPLNLKRPLANDSQRKVFEELFHGRQIFTPKYANDIYPELIRAFYYNMNFRKNLMTSHVKGKDIVLDTKTFSSICCDIPMQGDIIGFVLEEIEQRKQQGYGETVKNRYILSARYLKLEERLLHYFLRYVILPKFSNHSQISDIELQLMYAIKYNININWTQMIMQQMWHVCGSQSSLSYTIFITKILEHFGISLDGETKVALNLRESKIDIEVVHNMRFSLDPVTRRTYRHRTDRPTTPTKHPEPTIPDQPEVQAPSSSSAAMPSNQMIMDELVSLRGYITTRMDAIDTQNQQIHYELHHLSSRLNNMDINEDRGDCEENLAPDLGTVLMKTPTSQKEERKKTYQD
ncbi:hypothetical protein Lal_00028384 [Lupinus albus]|nr:hypothetical protein Lal_00028384 [Lupinus albus]